MSDTVNFSSISVCRYTYIIRKLRPYYLLAGILNKLAPSDNFHNACLDTVFEHIKLCQKICCSIRDIDSGKCKLLRRESLSCHNS